MEFLDRLRGYLERVEREPDGLPAIHVDVAAHRQHLAEASDPVIERAWERATSASEESVEQRTERFERLVEEMRQRRESLPMFVEEVADHILETLAPGASQAEVTKLINVAIDYEGELDQLVSSKDRNATLKEIHRRAVIGATNPGDGP